MKAKASPSKPAASVAAWSKSQPAALRSTCDALRRLIDAALPQATAKIWHGAPVWFDGENPVVGYSVKAKAVSLLFWNGQALDEPELKPVGKYGAAEAVFRDAGAIDAASVRRWLRKARGQVFDSQAFFKAQRAQRAKAGRS